MAPTGVGTMKAQRTLREELDRLVMLLQRSLGFWKRSLLVFLVTLVVAVPVVFTRPRSYRSETVILYQETIRSSDLTGGESGGQSDSRRVGARLREMLLSRASLEPIVKDLNLYDALNEKRSLVDAVDDMRKHITFRAREGDTFEISFIGDTPQQTQEVTRRLGDCIVQEAVARRAEQAKAVKDFLDAESERNKTELKAKEAELAKFFALHPEFAPPPGTPLGTMPTARPAGAAPTRPAEDPAIVALEARAARIERQLKVPGAAPVAPPPTPTAEPAPLPDSPELVAARQDLADKLARYTDKHPDVIAARNRVRLAEAAQAAARAAQPAPAPAPAPAPTPEEQRTLSPEERDALKKQLAQIVNEIAIRRAVLKSAGGAEPATASTDTPVSLEVEYRRLLHEVIETRDRQRQLDDRQFKAAITASSVMSDRNIQVSVLDPAFLPSHPISQPRSRLLMVGFVIGIFLALLTAFVSARLDDRIYDRVDLEVLDILPVVGVIPRLTAGDRKD